MPGNDEDHRAAALAALRQDYFSFLARHYPTLCLHDEFIFFPRLAAAWDHWFQVPRLEDPALAAASDRLTDWLSRLEKIPPPPPSTELAADHALLRQSLTAVLRELGSGGPWEWDPFLYLKAASLALAPVLAQIPRIDWQNREKLTELLSQVARLLAWGRRQVKKLSPPAPLLAAAAFADARRFLGELVPAFVAAHFPRDTALQRGLEAMVGNLRRFQEKVSGLPAAAPWARGEAHLAEILTGCWGWSGDLQAATAVLQEEVAESQEHLARLAARVRPGAPWTEALRSPALPGPVDLLALYRQEVARLWQFWQASPLLPPLRGRVVVAETPVYLRSLRSSASYAAPWGPPEETPGYFYVSPEIEDREHHRQHHRFLSAHETVPGHHFLDTTRLALTSPLRRQYESPLFYEGWACYAETLLISEGYLEEPRELLVGWQRRLWRALRGLVDLELQQGRGLEMGLERLRQAAYPEATARLQLLHLALNPGYQLCYTLGLREVLRLQAAYAPGLGLARFHEVLLACGQLPFYLVEKRLRGGPGGVEQGPSPAE